MPSPLVSGHVTHHSIQLLWVDLLQSAGNSCLCGDNRMTVTLQIQDRDGLWGNSYLGYDDQHTIENLCPQTIYAFRIKLNTSDGRDCWSDVVTVSTKKEPPNGVHLHRAIQMNNIIGVEKLLDSGEVNVEVTDRNGMTPLMHAAVLGYEQILDLLIDHNADVDAQNCSGKSALMMATFAGKLGSIQILSNSGANIYMRDKGGSTALHWAVDGGCVECVDWCLLEGWDVNVMDTGSNWTPLLRCAAVHGNKEIAKILIEHGAKANVVDKDGKTPLMLAVLNGHYGLVDVLLKNGADVRMKSLYGKNALEMAYTMNRRRISDLLETHVEKCNMRKGVK